MAKLILNESQFEIANFNRNTYNDGERINSTASITLSATDAAASSIHGLVGEDISTFIIKKDDGEEIYNAGSINAKITSVVETLMTDEIYINVNVDFR